MASLPSMSIQASITFPSNNTSSLSLHTTLRLNHSSTNHIPPRPHSFRSTLTFARRRNTQSSLITSLSSSSKKKKKNAPRKEAIDENIEEDAFEALFKQLEEDLKNDEMSLDDLDEEISEEELALLERELEEALGDSDELLGLLSSTTDETQESDTDVDEDGIDEVDEDDDEIQPVKLKNWQLRRLACALKTGRRKTSIKSLAAELCLDRAVVLEYLRDPPPNLLLMSASLPDKPVPIITEPEPEPQPEPEAEDEQESVEIEPSETVTDAEEPKKSKAKLQVHQMQGQWSAQKRLKKVEVETLERVYRRSKRPTNAMISSIVQVTNLPRKKIVKWFEDKRTEDGVPDNHLPYQRPSPETVFSS